MQSRSDADKVSIAFTVENRPGTLVEALQVFAAQETNLTKIESRPVQGKPWDYFFYVDYQISRAASADAVLAQLRSSCSMVKELGRYRSAAVEPSAIGCSEADSHSATRELWRSHGRCRRRRSHPSRSR